MDYSNPANPTVGCLGIDETACCLELVVIGALALVALAMMTRRIHRGLAR